MEKSINIIPPEGYEIDKEKSTFEKIVFKKKSCSIDTSDKHVRGYYYNCANDTISEATAHRLNNYTSTKQYAASEKVARSNAAKNRISHILKYDERFGGEITDEEWKNGGIHKYVIVRMWDGIDVNCTSSLYSYLAFHTAEQRDLFLKEYKDLIKDYYML